METLNAIEYLTYKFINTNTFRNFNDQYYINIDNEWIFIKEKNIYSISRKYLEKIIDFRTLILENEKLNLLPYHIKVISDLLSRSKSLYTFHKKVLESLKLNIPNTAKNVEECDRLPSDLLRNIFIFVPNDTNGEIVEKIVDKILLPGDQLIKNILLEIPGVLINEALIKLCIKYIRWLSINHIITIVLFRKFADEMNKKKCIPTSKQPCYKPINKEDHKYFKKKIFFDKTSFIINFGINSTIKYIFEDMFYCEVKAISLPANIDFSKLSRLFDNKDTLRKTYCENWETQIPELLSDKTNYLTTSDKYIMNQYAVWINYVLNIQKNYIENNEIFYKINIRLKEIKKQIKYHTKFITPMDN